VIGTLIRCALAMRRLAGERQLAERGQRPRVRVGIAPVK
jgi:hypothetical protein